MALIKCPECGKEISDKAETCPNCGYPIVEKVDEANTNMVNEEIIVSEVNQTEKKRLSKRGMITIAVIVTAIILVGVAYFALTANARNYDSAIKLFENEKYQEARDKFSELGNYKDSKKMLEKCKYELTVDGQFMRSLSKGLMARWAESAAQTEKGNTSEDPDLYSKYCEIELEQIEDFSKQTFDNAGLETDAKQYIEYLKTAQDATKYYTVDYITYQTQWSDTYAKRTILLQRFVDEYGLTVEQQYQETLDDLLIDASAAQEQMDVKDTIRTMTENFKIETTEDEWGYKSYKIIMKNTTDRVFEYFYVGISLQDESGKIVGSGNTEQIAAWQPEQEAVVNAWFDGEIDPNDYVIKYIPHYQSGTYYE